MSPSPQTHPRAAGASLLGATARHPLVSLAVLALLIAGLGVAAAGARARYEVEDFFPADTPERAAFERVRALFGRDDRTALLILEAPEPLGVAGVATLHALTGRLRARPELEEVIGPSSADRRLPRRRAPLPRARHPRHGLPRRDRRRHADPRRDLPIRATLRLAGPGLILTSVVPAAGFSVMMLSELLPKRVLGMLLAVTALYALVGDLLILPALLRVTRARGSGGYGRVLAHAGALRAATAVGRENGAERA